MRDRKVQKRSKRNGMEMRRMRKRKPASITVQIADL